MLSKAILYIILITGTAQAFGQASDAELDAMINLLGVQKKEAVAQLVNVSGNDSVLFWKIYEEYQQENKKTAADRVRLYEGTAMAYRNMTPQIADSLANLYFSNRIQQENRLQAYYKKFKSAINPTIAFEFYQAEVYLLTMLRAQIMQQIPTYGQLQLMNKKK
ncbi:hypothetical protein [Paraflavitalea sp. CAU 1676]|uniref:hypothetical protein n=1 Tax=Paraflavitalea sp. CAU 1676 TaxID=3032598 RepID=UPI0023DCB8A7|nr:hypothetical protein [Paraflavitalea sp. CAU 1676]MDF2188444.1 hypothetical protein [Paraflavitalea sp. CAU 1676]